MYDGWEAEKAAREEREGEEEETRREAGRSNLEATIGVVLVQD